MKKVLSIFIVVAMLVSVSVMTMISASAETKWKLPVDDIDQWSTWTAGSPPLTDATDISGEVVDGAMKLWFPDTATAQLPYTLVQNGGGIVSVAKGDKLNIDITLEGTSGGTDIRFYVEMDFGGAQTGRIMLSKYIGEAAGLEANEWGQLPQGEYKVYLDIEELLKAYDSDKNLTGDDSAYEKVFGPNGNPAVTLVGFCIATNTPAENSDKDQALIIREFSIGDAESGTADNSTTSTASDTSTTSTASKTSSATSTVSKTSDKDDVKTGESVMPIIGVAALAVVATSAVVVSRKKK